MESPEFFAKLRVAFLELVVARDPVWCYYDDGVALSATDVTRKRRAAELLAQLAVAGGLTTDDDNTADGAKALLAFAREGSPENVVEEVVGRSAPVDGNMVTRIIVRPAVVDLCSVAAQYCERLATRALAARARGAVDNMPHAAESTGGPKSPGEQNIFTRDADAWHIAFEGIAVTVSPNLVGLELIRTLLANPDREFSALELMSGSRSDDGILLDLQIAGNDVVDAQTLSSLKQSLADLHEREQTARETGNDALANDLHEQQLQIVSYQTKATNRRGRSRATAATADRARKAACKRFKTAMGRLRRDHRALYAHLVMTIRSGSTFCYRPDYDPLWSTEPVQAPALMRPLATP